LSCGLTPKVENNLQVQRNRLFSAKGIIVERIANENKVAATLVRNTKSARDSISKVSHQQENVRRYEECGEDKSN
jgi:hypothetical protein